MADVKKPESGTAVAERDAGRQRYEDEVKRLREKARKRLKAIRASRLIRDKDLQIMINTRD